MGEIRKIEQKVKSPHLSFYEMDVENEKGHSGKYFEASRAKSTEELEAVTKRQAADAVIVYSLYGERKDRVVLVRQYRYPINSYIYEFPAGLVEEGEDYHDAAVREMKEETGLTLHPLAVDTMYEKPYYTTIGMTDECCAAVYGCSDGTVRTDLQEISEEIEVVLADRREVRRILQKERVSANCAYMLMHFLKDAEPFAFLEEKSV